MQCIPCMRFDHYSLMYVGRLLVATLSQIRMQSAALSGGGLFCSFRCDWGSSPSG